MENRINHLKKAEKGSLISIMAYLLLAGFKLVIGSCFRTNALIADGLNNLTDVMSSIFVWVGLRLSQKPSDKDHAYGHWKFETIASLITSFVMFYVGLEVIQTSIQQINQQIHSQPHLLSALVALLAGIVMLGIYAYNNHLAQEINSLGLKAAAKDNLSDALTSFTTAIAIFAAHFHLAWLDNYMALLVGCIILKTAYDIFHDATFQLSDGFEFDKIVQYQQLILKHPKVQQVNEIKGRRYGSNIYLDITIEVDGHLSVYESHQITEEVEQDLFEQFAISFIDIHVEPHCPSLISKV